MFSGSCIIYSNHVWGLNFNTPLQSYIAVLSPCVTLILRLNSTIIFLPRSCGEVPDGRVLQYVDRLIIGVGLGERGCLATASFRGRIVLVPLLNPLPILPRSLLALEPPSGDPSRKSSYASAGVIHACAAEQYANNQHSPAARHHCRRRPRYHWVHVVLDPSLSLGNQVTDFVKHVFLAAFQCPRYCSAHVKTCRSGFLKKQDHSRV